MIIFAAIIIKILKKLFFYGFIFVAGYAYVMYQLDRISLEDMYRIILNFLRFTVPAVFILYVLYKNFFEQWLLAYNRKRSAEILSERISKVNQKSGAVRKGKDSSTVGAAILIKEHVIEKELKAMANLRHILYIYDFERLDEYLHKHGKDFLVAGDKRIDEIYSKMLRTNKCFIKSFLIKQKKVDPLKHYHYWKKYNGDRVLDFAFEDGLTPGGVPFLDMLKGYVILYVHHIFVPNFVLSNQPLLESYDIDGKKIKKLFSKKFSQDYIKLKEDKPIPLPVRGFIYETETAIFYANTDKALESENKSQNGIREFLTTIGHILREQSYYYAITQSPNRVSKAIRELYPGYQHVFKHRYRGTSNFKRGFISFKIILKKFKILRIKLYQKSLINPLYKYILKRKDKTFKSDWPIKRITRIQKAIQKLESKSKRLFNKGYIEFYIGIYENINDVGRSVSFPKVSVIIESKSDKHTYSAYGFKQTNRITDCFGRYDTHFMKFIRDEKEKVHSMHFNDVPNWKSFKLDHEDADYSAYKVFDEVFQFIKEKLEEEIKRKRKQENELRQARAAEPIPDFEQLEPIEILGIAADYGIDIKDLGINDFDQWKKKVIQDLIVQYKKFKEKG